jgi:hypothetical protein
MSKIRSTIGESNFIGQGSRRFVVGEESQASPQPVSSIPQYIDPSVVANMRRQAQENQEQVERRSLNDVRRRIEIILGLGRNTKDVPISTPDGNVVITLRTLKDKEQVCVSQILEAAEKITMPNGDLNFSPTGIAQIRREILTHSLFLIDGQSIEIILGTANDPYEIQVAERKALVAEMDSILLVELYKHYEQLVRETYDGYIPKTSEDAKEVVEAISKSGQNS